MNRFVRRALAYRHLSAARAAARRAAWAEAAHHYAAFLAARPRAMAAWVQSGHVLKALGDLPGSRAAYERALLLAPDVPDTLLHLAAIQRRLGERAQALETCARAAAIDPTFAPAIEELLALGGRDRLAGGVSHGDAARPPDEQPPWLDELTERQSGDVYGPSFYAAYRSHLHIHPAPAGPRPDTPVHIMIDGRGVRPVDIRATLSSLRDSADPAWTATIIADEAAYRHPVAGIAVTDPRIAFRTTQPPAIDRGYVLLVRAGTVIDREALGWFGFTAARTGCSIAYADHDRCIDDWRTGRHYDSPTFQPMFDPEWFEDAAVAPALLLVDTARHPIDAGAVTPLPVLATTADGIAHIPQLLGSIRGLAPQAARALPDGITAPVAAAAPGTSAAGLTDRIHVVVQTRDEPAMLREAIRSLRRLALRRDLLQITVVDNRSVLPATARLLRRYAASGIARILPLDEPFNWSRANNLAVAGDTTPILLFLNNDTTMLTPGWDAIVRRILARPGVAAAGALLSYPDGTIQHAGMIFGMGGGGPIHEGVGQPPGQAGPNGRWSRMRGAAAVTGAFLAVTRAAFDAVGGFDAEQLAIAFNDVDLCLKLRAAGHRIVQTGDIRLVHHESRSRGLNVTQGQVAWDLDELAVLHRRWGPALFDDPFYNPHWTRTGQPFDGYRFPGRREVLRHIDRSHVQAPWSAIDDRVHTTAD